MNVTAIILAGGKSSRMGSDKGLVKINGKPMISYLIDLFEALDIPVIIITSNENYGIFNKPLFADMIPDKGPIGGIYTGLFHSDTKKNLVISCDSPFINKEIIKRLLHFDQNSEIVFSRCLNKDFPLIGRYDNTLISVLKKNIEKDQLRMKAFIHEQKGKFIEFEKEFGSCFENINSQDELLKVTQ